MSICPNTCISMEKDKSMEKILSANKLLEKEENDSEQI